MAKPNPIQVQKDLKGMDYPASKQDLIDHAKKHGADKEVESLLNEIPDQDYETPAELSKALGQIE
ncbi:MAG TPA: DUF2795 domain-containing protein [Trichocoleus sp.]|jgi:hypothetical protein